MLDAPWPLDKIQGFLMRAYHMQFVRHFALSVPPPAGKDAEDAPAALARAFLRRLVDASPGSLKITSAEQWGAVKPEHCLNAGFTYPGLQRLGLPQTPDLDSFNVYDHRPFLNGAAASATRIGDIGPSAPAAWIISDRDFHVMLSLFADRRDVLETQTEELMSRLKDGASGFGVPPKNRIFESQELRGGEVYFGYRDGIAQPIIEGAPFPSDPQGKQDLVDSGAFFLGTADPNSYYQSVPLPKPEVPLGMYGCFGAFRLLRQDVEGFQKQIKDRAPAFGRRFGIKTASVQQLALKAKLCGRWPNGVSLAVFPVDGDAVPEDKPFHLLNDFNYTMSDGKGGTVPDDDGLVCPIGSHTRRGNMRVQSLNGVKMKDHRILRRAGPYQDPYNEKDRDDPTTERGLVGFFLGASLAAQFEFIQSNWINYRNGFDVVTDPADPVMGTNTLPPGKAFYQTVPASADDPTPYVAPMNSFVFTKGSAYLYFPGLDGIRYIAGR